MHLHFERNVNAKCDCTILSLSWMGKVPDELPEEEGWKLNRNNYYQEGWLATGNVRGVVGVTFTSSYVRRAHELPLRTNYNLRGHRSEVILVKWNEPYQKLASCDSSGVIFVWIKYEGRWSIELINDRSTPVTHFSWSHDGRMALICYQDGFVLVGSVAGQRYWSSMLSLDARITCGCWTPDDGQVYLGTASAQLVVMDVHGAMVSQVQIMADGGITSMAWSCEKFKMEEGEDPADNIGHVLAVALGNGDIVMMRGHDDVSPVRITTGFRGNTVCMEWANSKELLGVAGTLVAEPHEHEDLPPFKNFVKFYSDTGSLIYTVPIPCTHARVSSMTWGHAARRLFVAVGGAVCTARVWRVVAPLQLLARVRAAAALHDPRHAAQLPLPPKLQPALANLFSNTIRCNVPDCSALRRFVSRPPGAGARLHCTMLRHDDEEAGAYTLYLEHLGGLVPLLKGRRTSKIRPEFVIFDPQAEGITNVISSGVYVRESSSSSGTGSSSSGSAGERSGSPHTGSPHPGSPRTRAPRTPRSHHNGSHTDSCSSDTDREEGCSGSPRMQRRRRARERRKARNLSDKEDAYGYIDSLPEDVRLVEVTSNIWGTKFKMHGLARNVPANLGQVTYKTSLLHLQPRQMTLAITELRDDRPNDCGPDPTFNPNIFSEDEEDAFPSDADSPVRKPAAPPAPAPAPAAAPAPAPGPPALARAESYDDVTYIDTSDSPVIGTAGAAVGIVCAEVVAVRGGAATQCSRPPGSSRHAISPLRCEGSVPALQSPKNAVAPTDIIFERPAPHAHAQAVACGGRGEFCGTDYHRVRADAAALKAAAAAAAPADAGAPFGLSLALEPSRQVTIKKCDPPAADNCLSKLRKNICGRGEAAAYDVNARILKSLCGRGQEHEPHPDAAPLRRGEPRGLRGGEDLKFIDEETPGEPGARDPPERREREPRVQRTTTVVPISPVCATVPVYDRMTRSCSVGYLDLVEPALHAPLSLAALRGEPPRRLVLVAAKRPRRRRARAPDPPTPAATPGAHPPRSPALRKCGKSKSLDSSELTPLTGAAERPRRQSRVDAAAARPRPEPPGEPEPPAAAAGAGVRGVPAGAGPTGAGACGACRGPLSCAACRPPAQPPPPQPQPSADSDSDYSKYYSSLEQLAMRLLAVRSSRRGGGSAGAGDRESSSAPASPRPLRATPAASSPASPAPRPKQRKHRYSSASPIRQLLNSPLLGRRRNKKSESSDDENPNGGYSEVNGRNYRDLETFQKAQLRNKLKRGGVAPLGSPRASRSASPARRQLVMHNKAPMWNENSQVYQLDFGGRVTQESAKNFQIEYHGKQVMQFGRIDGNAYTLDFQYPFSALQAFAVALANVTQRLK